MKNGKRTAHSNGKTTKKKKENDYFHTPSTKYPDTIMTYGFADMCV